MDGLVPTLYAFFVEKLPYFTILVFIVGVLLRLWRWKGASKGHDRIQIDPISSIKHIVMDVIFFRKQFKTDKLTWAIIFVFHMSVLGIMFGHMRGFYWWNSSIFTPLGLDFEHFMVKELPIYVGWAFLTSQVLLLIRRLTLENVTLISFPNDYIALGLLIITSILGQGMRLIPPESIPAEIYNVVFIPGFIVLHLEKVPNDFWFFTHVLFTQLFVMYIPFSKLVHIWSGLITPALYGSRRKEIGV